MAKILYFSDDVELTNIQPMDARKFASAFPGIKGRRSDSFSMLVGRPITSERVFVSGQGWTETLLPVERVINYRSNPSKHECDDRCINASGRVMHCECSCGGKNHGKGH